LLGGLAGDADLGADVGPGVAERAQAGDGLADGGVDLGGEIGHGGQRVDVAGGYPAGVSAQDAAGETGVLVVVDRPPCPVLARREKVPRSPWLWAHIAVAALFANAVPYLLFAIAEQTVNSSTAGIINATTPLWTVVLALAVRHQQAVTSWQAAGLIVGFVGCLLIFFALERRIRADLSQWPGMPRRIHQLRGQLHLPIAHKLSRE
jgi:hypothetical protein